MSDLVPLLIILSVDLLQVPPSSSRVIFNSDSGTDGDPQREARVFFNRFSDTPLGRIALRIAGIDPSQPRLPTHLPLAH